ncbi:MAG: hypothetical protein H6832_05335 [Planctomycetes bacterium]|nr:hypothetical protein [Planctomycetota bacterium]MCB9917805.1 hypothetical protein [Planctomycetota bacterium]
MHRTVVVVVLNALLNVAILLGPGCSSGSSPRGGQRTKTYSWVWIVTGPNDGTTTGAARTEAFQGHFANMKRMARDRQLLVAGPFGEPRAAHNHRGMFLLNTADEQTARAIASSDPTGRAGVFLFEIEPFTTMDTLDRLNDMHEKAVTESGVEAPPPGFHCRSYVLVSHKDTDHAPSTLVHEHVLFDGIVGRGVNRRYLACLDATSKDNAMQLLPEQGRDAWTIMAWYATEEIVRLRR